MDLPEFIPEHQGLVDDPDVMNVLLMGKNGGNVDTMILVNINEQTRKITMISIPRDLYYKGAKINSVYARYGLLQQVRSLEDILGQKIHHYALIDMLVFRDVIDLLGGVTVTLERDLIDPSYRTCEGTVCTTLYYPAGTYHLDGTAALRVARSRKTTSDYDRAARQQLILGGLKEKAQSLGFGDADTLLALMQEVLDALETDIALDQALRYYFRYQNFELSSGHVISTGNILMSELMPVSTVTSAVISETCSDPTIPETCVKQYGAYISSPRNGNWDLIPWYVGELLNE